MNIELLGTIVTILSVAGVILNNRKLTQCFYLWIASNAISLYIHLSAHILSLASRDAIFIALAIEGILLWNCKNQTK